MKKLLVVFIVLCVSQFTSAQESLVAFKNSLKTSSSAIKDVIPIINENNNDLALFFADAKNVYGYLLNDKFELQDKLLSPEKRRKFKILIGSSIIDTRNYRVFLTNNGYTRFSSMTLSFDKKKHQLNEFNLEEVNERFIQTVTYKNRFYLISAAKRAPEKKAYSEGIYIYTFDKEGMPKRNSININKLAFLDKKGNVTTLPDLMAPYSNSFQKIEDNIPNSIEVAAGDRKMYTQDNKVIFSFDNNKEFAQFLEIDLETFEATKRSFDKPMKNVEKSRKKTNSYLNGNNIYTVASTKENFIFQVNNFKTDSLIKQFSFSKGDTINFKNTPIIQVGGMYDNHRELESSKKFLRKISTNKIGVSVIRVHGINQVTLGGYVEKPRGGAGFGFGGMSFGASFGNVNVFFNPTMFAYNSMSNTTSTRIECLFDDDFDHLGGEIEDNAFDKIDSFLSNDMSNEETIFRYQDYYIFLDYLSVTKDHVLRKFKD